MFKEQFGVDVSKVPGAGAAGGLAGALHALGGQLVSGFELVCEELGVQELVGDADLLVTGEGFVDENSFDGKVVGGVCELAQESAKPVLIVCGDYDDAAQIPKHAKIVSLKRMFGETEAMNQTLTCVERAVANALKN